VSYRDVPGIDHAYLAMDTEEGVEVVWNEAMFSETKRFKVRFSPCNMGRFIIL
jgi:nuclear receptor-binding protein